MNHGSKQFLAWATAFGLTSAVYAGGAYWLKKAGHAYLSQTAHASGDGHGNSHGNDHEASHASSHETNDHAADIHGSAHESKTSDHATPQGHSEGSHVASANHGEEHPNADHAGKQGHTPTDDSSTKHGEAHGEKHAAMDQAAHHDDKPHWSYGKNDAGGPSRWGDLAKSFSLCEKGLEQSPIDLRLAGTSKDAPALAFHYGQAKVSVENNGHTVQSNIVGGDHHIKIDGEKYSLAQFHFHAPSEHKISGTPSDMELHFVHKNRSGQLAVIGVMINEAPGKENKNFKPVWDIMPRQFNSKAEFQPEINLSSLVPANRQYFSYSGSLTTPPCSEGVRWFVLRDAAKMSGGQVEMYTSIFGAPTNRPVQPLQGRDVITNAPPAMAH